MKNYHFVYSKRVAEFLTSKGLQHICVAIEPKNQRMFSLFEVTDTLQELLNQYKQINQQSNRRVNNGTNKEEKALR
jgi:predicted amidophosphoribosyltransferase